MSDLTLIFDFLISIWESIAQLYLSHWLLTVAFSLVLLEILVSVLYKIRIKFLGKL